MGFSFAHSKTRRQKLKEFVLRMMRTLYFGESAWKTRYRPSFGFIYGSSPIIV